MLIAKLNVEKWSTKFFVILMVMACMMCLPQNVIHVNADSTTQNHALRNVDSYKGVWNSPPATIASSLNHDAPAVGNGDIGALLYGTPDNFIFTLGKTEWFNSNGAQIGLGRLLIQMPGMSGASYHMEQLLRKAEVDGTFGLSGNTLTSQTWISATDNIFITKISYSGSTSQNVTIKHAESDGTFNSASASLSGDVMSYEVKADSTNAPVGRIATRVIGVSDTPSGSGITLTLTPGASFTIITAIVSNTDSATYQSTALSKINALTQANVDSLNTAHRSWWDAFYAKSFIEIPDKDVEAQWYGSQYLMAVLSRAGETPPGLVGNLVSTKNQGWNGDFTLNYNYHAPFYFTMNSNHIALSDNFADPLLQWKTKAENLAAANGLTGAYYPVHISPNGKQADTNLWNQKYPGAYAASVDIQRFYYTYDTVAAARVYDYLKAIGTLWVNYLSWDGSRYVILQDSPHEGGANPQTNASISIGAVSQLLKGLIDISTALGVDSGLRATWQDRLDHMSAYPTFVRNSQTIFRLTEVGMDWKDTNGKAINQVFPEGQIGLSSDPNLLTIAYNTVDQMQATGRWTDSNSTNTFYPSAARIGYNPTTILNNLKSLYASSKHYNNFSWNFGGGGIENLNTFPATINEMFLQSYQNIIRIFPNWPANTNAKYGDLRAYGAFLVSSQIKNNAKDYVRIISEKGKTAVLQNPWPGQTLRIYRNGTDSGTMTGTAISIPTSANEIIHIAPNGTTYADILDKMAAPLNSQVSSSSGGFADDTDASIAYNGSWTAETGVAGTLNGTQQYASAVNNYAQFSFSGTQIYWIGSKWTNRGIADVYLDGAKVATVDQYSTATARQQVLYSNTGLANGTHTIKIVSTGTKSASSSDVKIDLDAFKFGPVDDADPSIAYNGSWTAEAGNSGLLNGTQHYTNTTNNYVQFTFTGTQISWLGSKWTSRGIADVYLDGAKVATVDQYSTANVRQQVLYVNTGLANGTHTIKIVNTGTKNAGSSEAKIDVDAFTYQ
jgi:alpha-L-fucosidase 2